MIVKTGLVRIVKKAASTQRVESQGNPDVDLMRVLIRQSGRSRFLADQDRWVSAREKGLDFVSSVMALNVATRMHLKDIEILLDFGDPRSDVVLQVPDGSKNLPKVL